VTFEDRFWRKVLKRGADECWPWTGSAGGTGGAPYGRVKLPRNGGESRQVQAHRVAYELCVGPIPEGLQLDHLCKNTLCVNPAHLEAVTAQENTLRGSGITAREAELTHCPKGHPYDAENTARWGRHGKPAWRNCRICQRESKRANYDPEKRRQRYDPARRRARYLVELAALAAPEAPQASP
jgi:hypothetical protein